MHTCLDDSLCDNDLDFTPGLHNSLKATACGKAGSFWLQLLSYLTVDCWLCAATGLSCVWVLGKVIQTAQLETRCLNFLKLKCLCWMFALVWLHAGSLKELSRIKLLIMREQRDVYKTRSIWLRSPSTVSVFSDHIFIDYSLKWVQYYKLICIQ